MLRRNLLLEDIEKTVKNKIVTRNYTKKPMVEGVHIIELINNIEEDGDFSELFRLDAKGELSSIPGFKLAQLNKTKLNSQSIKAWHLHLKQDVVWYIEPSNTLLVGIWDIRKSSKTAGLKTKILIGGGNSQLLFIPKGVAHGSYNKQNTSINLYYFTNILFDPKNADEKRIISGDDEIEFWKTSNE